MSASFPYVYNDIDDTMANYRQMAMQYGWQVVYSGKNPLAEPSFFPAIDPDKIMAMARLAARFNCNQSCGDLCYQPHPLLRIGKFAYCKLCTRGWYNFVTKQGESMKHELFERFHYDKTDPQIKKNQETLAISLSLTRIMKSGLLYNLEDNLTFDHERCCRAGETVIVFISTYRKTETIKEWLMQQGWTPCLPIYSMECLSFYKVFSNWKEYRKYYSNLKKGETNDRHD